MADLQMAAAEDFVSVYKCEAISAVCFKLVAAENDIFDKGKEFHPEFSHQFFGDSESIFGYKGLQVQLYFHAGSLLTYLGMTSEGDVTGVLDGIEPDPVLKIITEKLSPGFLSNMDEFIAKLPSESSFKPMGEMIHSYKRNDIDYEIYSVDAFVPKFKEYHSRLETFALWFINGASYIDIDDERWHYFLLFEKKNICGELQYNIAGYVNVYHYYAYPNKIRPRIGQMLLLPPFQRKGHGAELLRVVDEHYIKDTTVLDITVEDPSDNFLRLRDFVDSLACSKLDCFSPENLKKGFTNALASEAQKARKINKLQCRRVYEILRLKATDRSNPKEYKDYRLDVKGRLNTSYQKEKSDFERLKKYISSDELHAMVHLESTTERQKHLEQLYEEVESGYLKTIERLAAS